MEDAVEGEDDNKEDSEDVNENDNEEEDEEMESQISFIGGTSIGILKQKSSTMTTLAV